MALVILQPRSRTNQNPDYLVVDHEKWASFLNGQTRLLEVAGRAEAYAEAEEIRDRLNEGIHEMEKLSDRLIRDGVKLSFRSGVTGRNRWFKGAFHCEGRAMEHDWSTDARNPKEPTAAGILGPAIRSAQTAEAAEDYEDWASDFSGDSVDRATYQSQLAIAKNLRTLFGDEQYEAYSPNRVEHD